MKRRPVKVSRAASLKGWRTRRMMKQQRVTDMLEKTQREFIAALDADTITGRFGPQPTIDKIPKVEWKS